MVGINDLDRLRDEYEKATSTGAAEHMRAGLDTKNSTIRAFFAKDCLLDNEAERRALAVRVLGKYKDKSGVM